MSDIITTIQAVSDVALRAKLYVEAEEALRDVPNDNTGRRAEAVAKRDAYHNELHKAVRKHRSYIRG